MGCDNVHNLQTLKLDDFNPRTHRGVRHCLPLPKNRPCYFNPRTHRGVRLVVANVSWLQITNFNPRTHRGVRHLGDAVMQTGAVDFNPRTHRGVRLRNV